MMRKTILILVLALFQTGVLLSQNVGIGPDTTFSPDPSAILELKSSDKGFLFPRMTEAQRDAIASPATWLIINQTDGTSPGFYYYDGTQWRNFAYLMSTGSFSGWELTGNSGTNPTTNFIGTSDAQDLVFRTNNTETMRIESGGDVGIGVNDPTQLLHIQNGNLLMDNGHIFLQNSNDEARTITFFEPSSEGQHYTSFKAVAMDDNVDYLLPSAQSGAGVTSALVNDGTGALSWSEVAQSWDLTGNAGTDPITNFVGTTDAQDLVFRTNNTEKMRIESGGNVGIGVADATELLHVQDGNVLLDNSNLTMKNTDDDARALSMYEPSGSGTNFTSLEAVPMDADVVYKLPIRQSPQDSISTLVNDGTGQLAWTTMTQLSGQIRYNVLTHVSSSTYSPTEDDTHILIDFAGSCRINLPTGDDYIGKQYFIKRLENTSNVDICANGTSQEPIDESEYPDGITLSNDYSAVMLIYDGIGWYVMSSYGTVNKSNNACL